MDKTPAGPRPLVVGIGEALFDCLGERADLGGAPVNLCVHAHALLAPLGGAAAAATRVGDDPLGRRYRDELTERGLPTNWVQVDPDHATGRVMVELDSAGDATYAFEPDAAWDHLEWTPAWEALAHHADAVAFGTLAQRSAPSRETLRRFLRTSRAPLRLLDLNLRGEFYSAEVLDASLGLATALKASADELRLAVSLLNRPALADEPSLAADWIREAYALEWVAVTHGVAGLTYYSAAETTHAAAAASTAVGEEPADSVGAGDAAAAGLVVGSLLGWSAERRLGLAARLGAFVASRPGGTPPLPHDLARVVQRGEAG